MINLRILGIAMLVTSLGIVAIASHTVSASICPPMCDPVRTDIDVDEAAMAENNTTNMTTGNTNQTESQNMTSGMMDNSTG